MYAALGWMAGDRLEPRHEVRHPIRYRGDGVSAEIEGSDLVFIPSLQAETAATTFLKVQVRPVEVLTIITKKIWNVSDSFQEWRSTSGVNPINASHDVPPVRR
jgi:hypothetical protein